MDSGRGQSIVLSSFFMAINPTGDLRPSPAARDVNIPLRD